ncbi:polypeptide N-acetylgalactosaminyltransferase 2 [Hydra vulgaris]|uniref:Polypeptide N-acetylgalactosaminyltransferase 2 n=1 Tax=Hydra vulgaris TaxID=6087 RepID=A0ABM4CII8_HYDVU
MKNVWVAITSVLVCSLIFFTSLLFYRTNLKYYRDVKRSFTENEEENEMESKLIFSKQDKCPYSFGFIEELIEIDHMEKRRLLPEHRKQNFSGGLVNQDMMCLDTMDASENMFIGMYECHGNGRNQAITFTTDGLIEAAASKPLCLSIKNMISVQVVLKRCDKNDGTQIWTTDSTLGHVIPNIKRDYCLTTSYQNEINVDIQPCKTDNSGQRWQLIMNEVLLHLQEEILNDTFMLKKKRKQTEKLILHQRLVSEDESLIL